jgi:hypothetical protein
VIVHARDDERLDTMHDLTARGAATVVGDLADLEQTNDVAEQVNELGPTDPVIHNAGVLSGPSLLPVNVVVPYVMTADIRRPKRLVYLSSGMHRGGRARLTGMDWAGGHETGHRTQEWLAVSDDPDALTTGGYWYHHTRQEPHPACRDVRFQDELLAELAHHTGTRLT